MELYIIRHSPVELEKGICYGQSDIDVNELFDEYVKLYQQKLPKEFDLTYSSPLKRCKKLAEKLSRGEIKLDARLMEMNFGDWELKSWNAIPFEESNHWMENFDITAPPNGESMTQLFQRIAAFYNELKMAKADKVLIVTHAGSIRCFWALLLDIPLKNCFKIPIDFGEVLVINTTYDSIIQKA